MNDRVHQYLDGELSLEALNADERRAAQEHLRMLGASLPLLREVSAPDLTEPVMGRIAEEG